MKKARVLLSIIAAFASFMLLNTPAVFADIDFSNPTNGFLYNFFENNSREPGEIAVYTDGLPVKFDVSPQIINDRTMVPLRAIFEALGAEVSWDDSTKTAISEKSDIIVKITIGEYKLSKNGSNIEIDVPAQIVDSRTLVPVRAIAESFDCNVFWDGDLRTVRIVTAKLSEPELTEADITPKVQINGKNFSEAEYALWNTFSLQENTDDNQYTIDTLKKVCAYEEYFENHKITLTDTEKDYINHQISILRKSGIYDEMLSQYGITDASYRKALILSFSAAKAAFYAPEISDEEITEYCRKNLIRAKHILVKTEEEALAVHKQLEDGASFEKLAADKSLDFMNTETGYIFGKDEMVKEFEEAAFSLEENEMSGIVKTPYGFHIIKRYSMDEISDEYLLKNNAEIARYQINTEQMKNEINKIMENLTVTEF